MPGEQNHASAWIESDAEDGKIHLKGVIPLQKTTNLAQCKRQYGFKRKFTRISVQGH